MKKLPVKLCFVLLLLAGLVGFLYGQNNWLTVSTHTITAQELPSNFNGYKILHLSDLHDKEFGRHQQRLVKQIDQLDPDLIVFTGDMVDKRRYKEEPLLNLLKALDQGYPIYMVPGNHELSSGQWPALSKKIAALGVVAMDNNACPVVVGDQSLALVGVNDPLYRDGQARMEDSLATATAAVDEEGFTILLSHRPEHFPLYAKYNFNLTLAGHAHGGQVALPWLGAVYAPGQGLWPQYAQGAYELEGSTMVVSRGLGNSVVPLRLFNRPELVVVELGVP